MTLHSLWAKKRPTYDIAIEYVEWTEAQGTGGALCNTVLPQSKAYNANEVHPEPSKRAKIASLRCSLPQVRSSCAVNEHVDKRENCGHYCAAKVLQVNMRQVLVAVIKQNQVQDKRL